MKEYISWFIYPIIGLSIALIINALMNIYSFTDLIISYIYGLIMISLVYLCSIIQEVK